MIRSDLTGPPVVGVCSCRIHQQKAKNQKVAEQSGAGMKKEQKAKSESVPKAATCSICQESFVSKTKLFKHLEAAHGYEGPNSKPEKVVVLIGWLSEDIIDKDEWCGGGTSDVETGPTVASDLPPDAVEEAVYRALYAMDHGITDPGAVPALEAIQQISSGERPRGLSRGSSCLQRSSLLLGEEASCHGLCDTFCFTAKRWTGPVAADGRITTWSSEELNALWLEQFNRLLPAHVRALARYLLQDVTPMVPTLTSSTTSAGDFHAEGCCSQRRYEYMLPVQCILPPHEAIAPAERIVRTKPFYPTAGQPVNTMDQQFPLDTEEGQARVAFFRKLKFILKRFAGRKMHHNYTTGTASPQDGVVMRRIDKIYHMELIELGGEPWAIFSISGDSLLRGQVRRLLGVAVAVARGLLPEEFIAISLDGNVVTEVPALPGWGLYLAECRYAFWEARYENFRLDPRRVDGADCSALLDWREQLHNHIALISRKVGNSWLDTFESSIKRIFGEFQSMQGLINRTNSQLEVMLNEITTAEQHSMKQTLHRINGTAGRNDSDVVVAAYEKVLRLLREADASGCWPPSSVGRQKVILCKDSATLDNAHHLDASENSNASVDINGRRPGTRGKDRSNDSKIYKKRPASRVGKEEVLKSDSTAPSIEQSSIQSTDQRDQQSKLQRIDKNETENTMVLDDQSLRNENIPGSGSFSVGCLPLHLAQPKGNTIFPELMMACFELERVLCPHRRPSSTIAINRRAQFLPHRDSGAGSGQSQSLIVALGDFSGGEIAVDNVAHDIRYRPLEFNGWQQLHWTLPFVGERYSLVWFTPLGITEDDLWWWKTSPIDCPSTSEASCM